MTPSAGTLGGWLAERTGRTLLQSTFDRVLPLVGTPDRILVATAERYVTMVCEQLPELPREERHQVEGEEQQDRPDPQFGFHGCYRPSSR